MVQRPSLFAHDDCAFAMSFSVSACSFLSFGSCTSLSRWLVTTTSGCLSTCRGVPGGVPRDGSPWRVREDTAVDPMGARGSEGSHGMGHLVGLLGRLLRPHDDELLRERLRRIVQRHDRVAPVLWLAGAAEALRRDGTHGQVSLELRPCKGSATRRLGCQRWREERWVRAPWRTHRSARDTRGRGG